MPEEVDRILFRLEATHPEEVKVIRARIENLERMRPFTELIEEIAGYMGEQNTRWLRVDSFLHTLETTAGGFGSDGPPSLPPRKDNLPDPATAPTEALPPPPSPFVLALQDPRITAAIAGAIPILVWAVASWISGHPIPMPVPAGPPIPVEAAP